MRRHYYKSFHRAHKRPSLICRVWKFLISDTMAFLLGILAIIIGYYQFYLSRPILEYSSSTDKMISNANPEGPHMHINGVNYQNIYKSVISLMNSGDEALSGSDVSPIGHDPIRIPLPEHVKILYYNIDSENTSPETDAKLQHLDNAVIIKFEYLNPDNNIVINLFSEQPYDQYKIVGSAAGINQISKHLNHKQAHYILLSVILGLIIVYVLFTCWYLHRRQCISRI